ncbi:hypothetical protein Plhal304r1_c016g0059351 [Plasmopara halstedii]
MTNWLGAQPAYVKYDVDLIGQVFYEPHETPSKSKSNVLISEHMYRWIETYGWIISYVVRVKTYQGYHPAAFSVDFTSLLALAA